MPGGKTQGPKDDADTPDHLPEVISVSSEVIGAATGAAIGLAGGPLAAMGGAVGGAVIGGIVRRVASDVRQRMLSHRQRIRVDNVITMASRRIEDRLAEGFELRKDGFFTEQQQGCLSSAEELLEGLLLIARDSYEEKKLPLLAKMYANLAFVEWVTPSYAHYLIRVASELTYTQLVALAVSSDEQRRRRLRSQSYSDDKDALEALGPSGQGLLIEIYELLRRGFATPTTGYLVVTISDVAPGGFKPNGAGSAIAILMELDEGSIPASHCEIFYQTFPEENTESMHLA